MNETEVAQKEESNENVIKSIETQATNNNILNNLTEKARSGNQSKAMTATSLLSS